MSFGNYNGALLSATATLNATCSTGTPYTIGLTAGTGTGATVAVRKMKSTVGAEELNYTLSQDSAHTINWGNTPPTDTVAGTGNGAVQPHTVFGQIPSRSSFKLASIPTPSRRRWRSERSSSRTRWKGW